MLGRGNVAFASFGTAAPAASTGTAGVAALATQGELDAGVVNNKIVTPATLAAAANRKLKFIATVGDGTATQYDITHNFSTRDVAVRVYRNSGNYDTIGCDISTPTANAVRLNFVQAPTAAQFAVAILG